MDVQFFPAPHVVTLKKERDTALEKHPDKYSELVRWSFLRGKGVHEESTAIMTEDDFHPRLLVIEPAVIEELGDQEELANYAQALPKQRLQRYLKAEMAKIRGHLVGKEEEHDEGSGPAI